MLLDCLVLILSRLYRRDAMTRTTQFTATLTASAALLCAAPAMAATLYTGGGGVVQSGTNWNNGLPNSSNLGTIDTNASYTSGSSGLMDGYFMTLTAGTLTRVGGAVFNLLNGSMTVDGASAEFIYSGISLNNSSYTINSGSGTASTGSAARSTNLSNNSTASFNGGTSTFEREITMSGGSQFIVNGGSLTVNTNSSDATLSGFRTGTDGGTLQFNGGTTVANYLNMTDATSVVFGGTTAGSFSLDSLAFDPLNLPNVTLNWLSGSKMSLTVTGQNQAYYESLWTDSRLQFNGANTGSFGDHFVVSGATLTLIPEPASLGLLGLGGLALLRRRRLA
jgi:hypothetical protein